MIKVLFFMPNLAHGGAERVLTNLVNHIDYTKFDVSVQTMFDVGIYRDKLNKQVRYIGGFPLYFRGNTWIYKLFSPQLLYRKYIKDKYDVIVSYLEGPSARVISGAPKEQKTICWIHIQFETEAYMAHAFRNRTEAICAYQSFNKIVCVSESVRNSFQSKVHVDNSVGVIYNTVETDVIRRKSLEHTITMPFKSNEFNIISVAKLMKSKGFDRLIRILKRLRDEGIPAHIYIVGKGEERRNLEALLKENNIREHWSFLGFQENPYQFVRNADLYVCCSHIEGFSTAVTEALIVGTPVVSTECSGAKELLGDNNEFGIVTDNNESALYEGIKSIITTPNLLRHYKKQAEIRGKQFNPEVTVKHVEDMLKEIASQ